MSSNQMLFAWPSADYAVLLPGLKSSGSAIETHDSMMNEISSCIEGESQIDYIELGVTGPALHWCINTLIPKSMVGWAVMGQPVELSIDSDVTGFIHNNQVRLNSSILSNIKAESVRAACKNLPDRVYHAETLRENEGYVAEMFGQLQMFYENAAAHNNAVISCRG